MMTGLVDIQVNGYGGVDFSSPELAEAQIEKTVAALTAAGTTAFLPTIITSARSTYRKLLPLWSRVMRKPEYAGVLLGLHLEGPFLSSAPGAIGAHNPKFVAHPDTDVLDELVELAGGTVRMITVAAGVPGIESLIAHARRQGIVVFLGHHLALAEDIKRASTAGATGLTHLGNGVPVMLPRHPNPVIDGMAAEELVASFIADGHHLPYSFIKVLMKSRDADHLIAISDSSPVAGLPPGEYEVMGDHAILDQSGRLYNDQRQCLVGSSYTILHCMNVLHSMGVDEKTLSAIGYYTPLKVLGISPSEVRDSRLVSYRTESGFTLLRNSN